jgi:hypothetical protein
MLECLWSKMKCEICTAIASVSDYLTKAAQTCISINPLQ